MLCSHRGGGGGGLGGIQPPTTFFQMTISGEIASNIRARVLSPLVKMVPYMCAYTAKTVVLKEDHTRDFTPVLNLWC